MFKCFCGKEIGRSRKGQKTCFNLNCRKIYQRKWALNYYYTKYRKQSAENSKRRLLKYPEKFREYNRYWAKKNPDKRLGYRLKREYGISLDDFNKILLKQKGVCAICKCINGVGTKLFIDHNHKTKKVRGLLCYKCNFAVGHFKEDISNLKSAMKYLKNGLKSN